MQSLLFSNLSAGSTPSSKVIPWQQGCLAPQLACGLMALCMRLGNVCKLTPGVLLQGDLASRDNTIGTWSPKYAQHRQA